MSKIYSVNVELNIEWEAESATAAEKTICKKLEDLFEGSDFDQLVDVDIIDVS